ncbi:MAG: O-antigen ligase family protein, partial [Anaerolineae bacterium]
MRSKVSVFCERVLEGGWLLAVIITPLFFDVYSSRVFEPDKLTLLRTIAVAMVVFWLVKQTNRYFLERRSGNVPFTTWLRRPFIFPTLLIVLVYLISSIFSVFPRASWLGSYQRLQGTFTTYSYIVIALIVMHELRRKVQFDRLISTVIMVSFPIALYGLIQHFGIDAMPWGSDVTMRVASNMGNAIFVAAFIILAIPVTLARLIQTWQGAVETSSRTQKWLLNGILLLVFISQVLTWVSRGLERGLGLGILALVGFWLLATWLQKSRVKFVAAASYIFVLSVQLMCLVYSQSRGPQLGFIAGMALFVLLYATIKHWRNAVWAWLAGGAAVVSFLVVFNLPNTPLAGLRSLPYIGRLGNLLETSGGTGKVRLLIWQGAVKLITANPLRFIIGYGPETMYVAYNKYYPAELAHYESRNASPDRSHNETLDSFVITGLLGFLAYVLIFASLFYYALKWIGLIQSGKDKRFYAVSIAAGTFLGLGIPFLLNSNGMYTGVGAMLGFVAGLFTYLLPRALAYVRGSRPTETGPETWKLLWIAALASAGLSHFVEINFGIAIASTRTYFWVYLALVAILGVKQFEGSPAVVVPGAAPTKNVSVPRRKKNTAQVKIRAVAASTDPGTDNESPRIQVTIMAIILGYVLSIMVWTFVTNPNSNTDFISILVNSFTTWAAKGQPNVVSLAMLWLILSTFFFGAVIAVTSLEGNDDKSANWWMQTLGLLVAISGVITLVYAFTHAARLATISDVTTLIGSFYNWTVLIWILLVVLLYFLLRRPQQSGSGWSLLVGAGSLI